MALKTKTIPSPTVTGYVLTLNLTENSTNTAGNYSDIDYSLVLKAGSYNFSQYKVGWSVSLDGSVVSSCAKNDAKQISVSKNSSVTIASGNVKIYHNSDGQKNMPVAFSIDITKASYTSGPISVNGQSMVLTVIPRATQPSVPDVTIGSAAVISLPRASSSFTHTLSFSFGELSGTIGSGYADKASWTVPVSLAQQIPNSEKGSGTITCTTYSGNTLVGTKTVNFTAFIPSGAVPSISDITISEAVGNIAATFGSYIQLRSQLRIVSKASGTYGASIKNITVTFEGVTYDGSDIITGAVKGSGKKEITVKAADSRGRTFSKSAEVNITPYTAPTAEFFGGHRADEGGNEDDEGEFLSYNADYTISSLGGLNTALYQVQCKKTTESSWSILDYGTQYKQAFTKKTADPILYSDDSYNLRIMLKDYFETVYIYAADIPMGFVLIEYDAESGRGISYGAACKGPGFHLNMPFDYYGKSLLDLIYPVGSLYISVNETSPAELFGGKWERFGQGRTLVGVDTAQTEFNAPGKTGGEKSHKLTPNEMPSHGNHLYTDPNQRYGAGNFDRGFLSTNKMELYGETPRGWNVVGNEVYPSGRVLGGDVAHNNLQPYITCFMWVRTA